MNLGSDSEQGVTRMGLNEPPPPYQPGYGNTDPAPPSYSTTDPTEAPPSYESLYGRVKAAKTESSGVLDFFKKLLIIVLSTIGCTICVGIVLAIPISMIAIGSVYDCPKEHYIPIYMIVGGVFGVLKNLSSMVQRLCNQKNEQEEDNAKTNPVDGILNCFLIAWFIAGNVWVYRTYGNFTTEDPTATDYCNPTLYWSAFWIITASYIFLGLSCLCICCVGLFAVIAGDSST